MLITIVKVALLLCVIIIPIRGPSRRKETRYSHVEKTLERSNYGINENGSLEEIFNENDKKEDYL